MIGEGLDSTLGNTCLVPHEPNLVFISISSIQVLFWLKFPPNNFVSVNVEFNSWFCNLIHGHIDYTKLIINFSNRGIVDAKMAYALMC